MTQLYHADNDIIGSKYPADTLKCRMVSFCWNSFMASIYVIVWWYEHEIPHMLLYLYNGLLRLLAMEGGWTIINCRSWVTLSIFGNGLDGRRWRGFEDIGIARKVVDMNYHKQPHRKQEEHSGPKSRGLAFQWIVKFMQNDSIISKAKS